MKLVTSCVLAFTAFTLSCTTNENNKTDSAEKNRKDSIKNLEQDSIKHRLSYNTDNYYNYFACLISGIRNANSKYNYLLDSNTAWKKNVDFIHSAWLNLDTSRLKKIERWRESEFPDKLKSASKVFYPFSGPDFLTAITFFPDLDTLVMLGLEKVGRFPELDNMSNQVAENYIKDFNSSLTDIFKKSYFITKNMQKQISNHEVNGILPVISFFMKHTGNEIVDVNYLLMQKDSNSKTKKIVEAGYNYNWAATANGKETPLGVKINYIHSKKLKTVYYYRYDISNKNFNDSSAFFRELDKMHTIVTYLKSASYLLSNKLMSNIRDLITGKSAFILQDDTGIPYSFLMKQGIWDVKIYGRYTRPVKDFPYITEDLQLKTACLNKPIQNDLPFHLGYNWGNKKGLLMLATKK